MASWETQSNWQHRDDAVALQYNAPVATHFVVPRRGFSQGSPAADSAQPVCARQTMAVDIQDRKCLMIRAGKKAGNKQYQVTLCLSKAVADAVNLTKPLRIRVRLASDTRMVTVRAELIKRLPLLPSNFMWVLSQEAGLEAGGKLVRDSDTPEKLQLRLSDNLYISIVRVAGGQESEEALSHS